MAAGEAEGEKGKLYEGAVVYRMDETTVRTVYDFPVVGHLCSDGSVRNVKLVRRNGAQPEGTCQTCQTAFQYRKPKPSAVRHFDHEAP